MSIGIPSAGLLLMSLAISDSVNFSADRGGAWGLWVWSEESERVSMALDGDAEVWA